MSHAVRESVKFGTTDSESPAEPAVALDVGGTSLKAGLVTPQGRLIFRAEMPTHPQRPAQQIEQDLIVLHDGCVRFRERSVGWSAQASRKLRIGVALPGLLSPDGQTIARADHLPTLNGYPLPANLRRRLGRNLFVGADSVCAAQADYVFGAGRGAGRRIVAVIGTGIGACLLVEGSPSADRRLGQIAVKAPGAGGGDFDKVPLETVASAGTLDRAVRRAMGTDLDYEAIGRAIESGPPPVQAAVRQWAAALAEGFGEWARRFRPEGIVVAGGVVAYGPGLLKIIRAACREHSPVTRLSVEFSPLGRDAGLIGAGWGAHQAA
jgi:glucokinase